MLEKAVPFRPLDFGPMPSTHRRPCVCFCPFVLAGRVRGRGTRHQPRTYRMVTANTPVETPDTAAEDRMRAPHAPAPKSRHAAGNGTTKTPAQPAAPGPM